MNKKITTTITLEEAMKTKGKTRKDALSGPPLPEYFWKHAKVVYPESPKEQVTVRLDADIVYWFKQQGRGYQTPMNAVLRSYVEARKDEPNVKR